MALILLTNDDGYQALGLKVLEEGLQDLGEVWVVAPHKERSGASHSITLHQPLRVIEQRPRFFSVSGTPVDCVMLAVHALLPKPPDVVISGINAGYNVGEDVFYSGTVAGAREAALLGIPALAVSVGNATSEETPETYEKALPYIRQLLPILLKAEAPALLNLNLPPGPASAIRGLRVTRLGNRCYDNPVERLGPETYVIAGEVRWTRTEGTDLEALSQGYASVTPLDIDLTDDERLEDLRRSLSG